MIIPGLVLLLLLLQFARIFSLFLISPPSEDMSREIPIAQLDYGFSRINNSHVLTIPGEKSTLILAVDGKKTAFYELDIKGRILQRRSFDLDLSKASQIKAYQPGAGQLQITYLSSDLVQADLDLSSGEVRQRIINEDSASFDAQGDFLVTHSHGAFDKLQVISPFSHTLYQSEEDIMSYAVSTEGQEHTVLAVVRKDWNTVDLQAFHFSEGRWTSHTILEKAAEKMIASIEDIYISDGVLTVLYKYRDGRDQVNRVTLHRIETDSWTLKDQFSYELPIYNSRYTIVSGDLRESRFIHQIEEHQGVSIGINLAMAVVDKDGGISSTPLTKTKSMSKFGGLFRVGDTWGLVFSDIDYDARQLLFSSGDPELIRSTSRFSTLPIWYPAGTTLALFLLALTGGFLYLLAQLPLPLFLSWISDRILKNPLWIFGTIVFIHMGIQVYLSSILISYGDNYVIHSDFFGDPPGVYGFILVLNLLCFLIFLPNYKNRKYSSTTSAYIRFAGIEYMLYAAAFLIYPACSIVLGKV